MAIVYQDTVRGEPRLGTDIPSSRENVLTEQFAQTFEENPIKAAFRWDALREDQRTGPRLDAATARQKLKDAGLDGHLQVNDAGITQAALDTLMERKHTELRRQEIFSRAQGGAGEFAQRLGLSIATTLADPISMGLNFVPVVGQARYARWLADAGSMAGRIGVRAGVGALEGAAGAALQEPFIYGMRTQEQADYDAVDSLLNVTLGGITGAGLHATVGSVGELITRRMAPEVRARVEPIVEPEAGVRAVEPLPADIQRALFAPEPEATVRAVDALTPEAQHAALRAAVGQAVEGRPINVEGITGPAIRQTDTPEFREWFGGSKAVSDTGEPLRVFRGEGRTHDDRVGLWYTSDPENASIYAEALSPRSLSPEERVGRYRSGAHVIPAYLSVKNPLVIDAAGARFSELPYKGEVHTTDSLAEVARAEGHDGLIVRNVEDGSTKPIDVYAAFHPEQVKSAVGNSGRFDPKAANLTDPRAESELKAAMDHAEEVLAREPEHIPVESDEGVKLAEEEAALAISDAKALMKRLGIDYTDEAIAENLVKAERWAEVAELATVCLTR